MRIKILLKHNVDYKNMNVDLFKKQVENQYSPSNFINKIISNNVLEIWNKYFSINYFRYRNLLYQETLKSLNSTGCDVIRGREDLIYHLKYDKDFIVIPFDDDDYLSPNISEIIPHFSNEDISVLNWKRVVLQCTSSMNVTISEGNAVCCANFSFRDDVLRSNNFEIINYIYSNHKALNNFIKRNSFKRKYINEHYSVHLRHLGSLKYISQKIDDDQLLDSFYRSSSKPIINMVLPDELEWCQTHSNGLNNICSLLRRTIRML